MEHFLSSAKDKLDKGFDVAKEKFETVQGHAKHFVEVFLKVTN
jgi:hypothetical protein